MKFKLNQIYTCLNSGRQYKYRGKADDCELFTLVKMGLAEVGSHLLNSEYRFYTKNIKEVMETTFKLVDQTKNDKAPS